MTDNALHSGRIKKALRNQKPANPESGVAIFYIFLGIAMFAALSYAASNMFRGGGNAMNSELYNLYASEILQFSRGMRTATHSMKIDGISVTEISFENNFASGYTNGNCTNNDCLIFNPDGGNMTYSYPNAEWLDASNSSESKYGEWYFSGANSIQDLSPSTDAELMLILPWLRRDLCIALNNALDVTNPGGLPPQDDSDFNLTTLFTGSYVNDEIIGNNDPELDNQRAACFTAAGAPLAGSYHFFQVLDSR